MNETFYSVEHIPRKHPFNCWNQYALTHSKWSARLQLLEAKLSLGIRKNKFRIREV